MLKMFVTTLRLIFTGLELTRLTVYMIASALKTNAASPKRHTPAVHQKI
jgi:hypothetical protein